MSAIGTSKTRELLVRFALGQEFIREAIDWACDLLVGGEDTTHLRLLAGYSVVEAERSLEEFRADFRSTLEELGISVPPTREAFSEFACFICKSYLDGVLPCDTAHRILYQIWIETNYDARTKIDDRFDGWMYLCDSRSLVAEGYEPLLEKFDGLNEETYEEFFRKEAVSFLVAYEPKEAKQNSGTTDEHR